MKSVVYTNVVQSIEKRGCMGVAIAMDVMKRSQSRYPSMY